MNIRKAKLPKEFKYFINFYRNKEINEFEKIKVRWACGKDIKYLRNTSIASLRYYSIFWVNTKDLINKADFGEMKREPLNPNLLFNNVDERDWRVAKILDHWNNNKHIDPPEITTNYLGKIGFGDGRHRTVVAFHLGEDKIPVIIHETLVDKISQILELKSFNLDI